MTADFYPGKLLGTGEANSNDSWQCGLAGTTARNGRVDFFKPNKFGEKAV